MNRHQSPKFVENTGLMLEIDNRRCDNFAFKIVKSVKVFIAAEDIA